MPIPYNPSAHHLNPSLPALHPFACIGVSRAAPSVPQCTTPTHRLTPSPYPAHPTASSGWPPRGASPRVSTAAPGGASRAPPSSPTSATVRHRLVPVRPSVPVCRRAFPCPSLNPLPPHPTLQGPTPTRATCCPTASTSSWSPTPRTWSSSSSTTGACVSLFASVSVLRVGAFVWCCGWSTRLFFVCSGFLSFVLLLVVVAFARLFAWAFSIRPDSSLYRPSTNQPTQPYPQPPLKKTKTTGNIRPRSRTTCRCGSVRPSSRRRSSSASR